MMYRVLYKKYMATQAQGQIAIVEDDIEAATFEITDGVLVLIRDARTRVQPFMAFPPGVWMAIEPAQPPVASIIT